MKVCVLLFGIIAFMLTTALSSLTGTKKCRKQLALTSYTSITTNQNEKQQNPNSEKPTDGTCSSPAPVAICEQQKEPTLIVIATNEFNSLSIHTDTKQYLDPPFTPPRREKDFTGNFF